MGKYPDPKAHQNRWLREAHELGIPVIYFLGISHRRYLALFPAFITSWNANSGKVHVAFGSSDRDAFSGVRQHAFGAPESEAYDLPGTGERRLAFRSVQGRLHRAKFHEKVIEAYGGKCALSGLSVWRLLDAARIFSERGEKLGFPDVQNGLALTKLHRAALGANLFGIDPDYGLHVSPKIIEERNGPMLEALKHLDGGTLRLPTRVEHRPNRDMLAMRFEQFKAAAA